MVVRRRLGFGSMTANSALTARISSWSRSHSGRVAARMMRPVFLLDMTAPLADCGGERRCSR
jgi:hypothetical protein